VEGRVVHLPRRLVAPLLAVDTAAVRALHVRLKAHDRKKKLKE
jgi:hypothetical protein